MSVLQPSPVQPRGMRQLYSLGLKQPLDMSLSENPLGCSPLVRRALKGQHWDIPDYPAPNGQLLKSALADRFQFTPQNFFVSAGSETIITALPRVLAKPGEKMLVPSLTFPMFRISGELAGLTVEEIPMTRKLGINLSAIVRRITPQTKLVIICNPNNPTGNVLTRQKILRFLEEIPPTVMVVVDEANIEFGGQSVLLDIPVHPNLVVLRTFSKGFGLTSLRVGFAAANESIITKLEEETNIFPVSGMSEALAVVALQDLEFIERTRRFIAQERRQMTSELERLGFLVFPSQGNNIFVRIPEMIAADSFTAALAEAGVSVVSGTNFSGFDERFFRVSMRLSETNTQFIQVLAKIQERLT